jgi:hypothetical protein
MLNFYHLRSVVELEGKEKKFNSPNLRGKQMSEENKVGNRVDSLKFKNITTGEDEVIVQHDFQVQGWGFRFMVDSEAAAYKAAYRYRFNKFGVVINYSLQFKMWAVTVYNAAAHGMGCDCAVAPVRECECSSCNCSHGGIK